MNPSMLCEVQRGKWKSIAVGDEKYSICATETDGGWKISLTDLIEIWTEQLGRDEVLQKCEKLNPSLSIEDIDVHQFVREIFQDIPKHAAKVSVEKIKLSSELEGGVFEFEINLTKGSARQLWDDVTMPLCLVAGELTRRQAILLDLIEKKDAEITEYKLNDAKLTRKHLRTEPFHKDLFKKNVPTQNAENCQNLFQRIMELREVVEVERSPIKVEPAKTCFPESLVQTVISTAANDEAKPKSGKRYRHTLLSVEGPARQKRRRCVECYRKRRQSGLSATDAASLTKQVKTYCDNCSDKPHLCLTCFNSTHENISMVERDSREVSVKIEAVDENSEGNSTDLIVDNEAPATADDGLKTETIIQESNAVVPKVERSSPMKTVTGSNNGKINVSKRYTRSAPAAQAKRTKKNIHDFIK